MRRKLTNKERQQILDKTSGRCAYCGCEGKMQIDHIVPIRTGGLDVLENMFPACRSCNHRKSSSSLESFRKQIEDFLNVLYRDSVTYRNALRFGHIEPKPQDIVFYFEKLEKHSLQN